MFKQLKMVQLSLCFSEGLVQISIDAQGTGLSQINIVNKYIIWTVRVLYVINYLGWR